MRTVMVGCCLVLLAAAGDLRAHAADPSPGPTVVIAPGDVTPLRGNIRNPLGPSQLYAPVPPLPRPSVGALERDLERDLGRLPSRTLVRRPEPEAGPRNLIERPEGPEALPAGRDAIDRARARAALEAFKTLRPNAPATPRLERGVDRLERPTDLGQ